MPKTNFLKIHCELGNEFYDVVKPSNFANYKLRYKNSTVAESIGLNFKSNKVWCDHFVKFKPLVKDNFLPIALKYHGHQFGIYNPEIGDGRGFLFAQVLQKQTNKILDLGTKGSGKTPFSRSGDGKLTLKGAYREILATEALDAFGVPTSHTFSVIETFESLYRNDEPSPARSAILFRLLHSHIRIGTFQRLLFLDKKKEIEKLLRHVVKYYYEDINSQANIEDLIILFLREFSDRVADMVSSWMVVGFVHGVMNTDNFNITGETFDFGPWRFLEKWDLNFVAAYFDRNGRYSFGKQPEASFWSLCRLADCFIPFIQKKKIEEVLIEFYDKFETHLSRRLVWRLGLKNDKRDKEFLFSKLFYKIQCKNKFFLNKLYFDLYSGVINTDKNDYKNDKDCEQLIEYLKEFKSRHKDNLIGEKILKFKDLSFDINNVERIWKFIETDDDWSKFNQLIKKTRNFKKLLFSN